MYKICFIIKNSIIVIINLIKKVIKITSVIPNLREMGPYGISSTILKHWMKNLLPPKIIGGYETFFYETTSNQLDRLCSFDQINNELDQEDLVWIEETSGYPLEIFEILWSPECE
ncbi:MAG TPA: hypothetical protein VJB89_03700 [Candidatus Nanoarchaeia archaeon]|nr:hypothetical protein [Candidatus Nanoarchaeia archaeon]